MTKETVPADEKVIKKHPPEQASEPGHDIPERQETAQSEITRLQKQVGNRAVQRLLTQRSGTASSGQAFEVEDETAQRIERERSGGEALDSTVQKQMGGALGFDFSQVKVHASPEANALNRELGAEAFTTGNDIYFREGAYDPGSSSGQELLAHEMTHVVQQSSGSVGEGGTKMTVNAPDDSYEKNADAVAQGAVSARNGSAGAIQTQELQMQINPEEEEKLKKGVPKEEEELQMRRRLQRQETTEEEEKLKKGTLEEEEEVQMQRLQRQEIPEEEEEVQMQRRWVQRVQRQEIPEEEEPVQAKRSHEHMRGKKH